MPRNVFDAINFMAFKAVLLAATILAGIVVIGITLLSPTVPCAKGYVEVRPGMCVLGYAKGTEPAFDARAD